MIESIAYKIAVGMKRIAPEHPSSVGILKHGLALVINAHCIVFLTLLISLFTGRTSEALVILQAFAILRQLTGGIHLETGMGCIAVSTTLLTVLSLISIDNPMIIELCTGISLLLIIIFAPSNMEESRVPKKYFPYMKLAALMMVGLNFVFMSTPMAVACLGQSLTLIKLRG